MPFQLELFQTALHQGGLAKALGFLNEPVSHRYTGVYRLRDGHLHNVELHDKQGEVRPEFLAVVPLQDSFCQFVLREGAFRTSNTGTDERLNGHKYQGVLLSYHGVPVLDNRGELFGTLCHFDAQQKELGDEQFDLMQRAARFISPYLPA